MISAYSGKTVIPETIFGTRCDDMPLQVAIAEVIQKFPNQIALSYNSINFTYAQLDRAASSLALSLEIQGVRHRDKVAILMHRTENMVISLLAVLRLGAAYIPIDPSSPEERIDFIINDTKARALILGTASSYAAKKLEIPVITEASITFDESKTVSRIGDKNLESHHINSSVDASDLAYIIYTSGSTGKPKGVKVTHANIQNYAYWARLEFGMAKGDIVDFSTTMAFDIAAGSTLLPLLCGARVQICPEEIRELPHRYLEYLAKRRVSILTMTPSSFGQLKKALKDQPTKLSLEAIWLAGEALIPSDVKAWLTQFPSHKIMNEYGPTETTIGIFAYRIMTGNPYLDLASIPIGLPTYNTTAYIVDSEMSLCPEGEVGELCIAGKSVSEGYLNRPELNANSFLDNPFESNGKLYRTGDLVRMLDDGNMEYLGRLDRQIKIRGFRIEPGEIESVFLSHEFVDAVTVQPLKKGDDTKLIAYLKLYPDKALSIFELRQYLKKRLPEYMVPSYFFFLEKIPITVNGKLDREALPFPGGNVNGAGSTKAESDIEKSILDIWTSILNSTFGVTDDFFILGGESINAAQIIYEIEKTFTVVLSLQDFYKNSNIRALAKVVQNKLLKAISEDELLLNALADIEGMPESEIERQLKS